MEIGSISKIQYNLGVMYYEGNKVQRNFKKAFRFLKVAAESNVSDAMYALGVMYHEGFGVKRNYKKSFKWYSKGAEKGSYKAMYNLGKMYLEGQGIRINPVKALKLFDKSARGGVLEAKKAYSITHQTLKKNYAVFEMLLALVKANKLKKIESKTVNIVDFETGGNLLHKVASDCMDGTKLLLDSGINCYHKNYYGKQSIHVAAKKGCLTVFKEILSGQCIDIDDKSTAGYTSLHLAIQNNHFSLVKFIITKGGDVNLRTPGGLSPTEVALKANIMK